MATPDPISLKFRISRRAWACRDSYQCYPHLTQPSKSQILEFFSEEKGSLVLNRGEGGSRFLILGWGWRVPRFGVFFLIDTNITPELA